MRTKTVVGTTSEVAGQVLFDPVDPAAAQFSEILINARTLETDRPNRDRAMRSAVVLNSGSDEHEFITFVPTTIEGLDGPIAVGEELTFDVTGELTIKGTTQPVTFSVTAVLEADDRLSGRAEAEVLRSDFGIDIPRAPGVADVTDEVTISSRLRRRSSLTSNDPEGKTGLITRSRPRTRRPAPVTLARVPAG